MCSGQQELEELNIDCHQSVVEGCSRDIHSLALPACLLQGPIRLLGTEEEVDINLVVVAQSYPTLHSLWIVFN